MGEQPLTKMPAETLTWPPYRIDAFLIYEPLVVLGQSLIPPQKPGVVLPLAVNVTAAAGETSPACNSPA